MNKNLTYWGDEILVPRSAGPRRLEMVCRLWSASSSDANNSQVAAQSTGAGSVYALGSGQYGHVTIETLDPDVAEAAITGETSTANAAIAGVTYNTQAALSFANATETAANVNSALAFSTIEQLTAGNTAAQEDAANEAAAAQLNAANGYGVSGTTGSAIAASDTSTSTSPSGATSTTTGSSLLSTDSTRLTNVYYLVGIAAAAAALWYFFKTGKA